MSAADHTTNIPRYMERFHCIGPDCERTCCSHWTVPVDEGTYKAFRRVPDRDARALLTDGLTKTRELKMTEDGRCHFLEEDGLCVIHRQFGHGMLPRVCGTFPRGLGWGEDGRELHASASCPEVARQMLFDPQALEIVGQDDASNHLTKTGFTKTLWSLEQTHHVVAQATTQLAEGLIRDRAQPLWQGVMDVLTLYYTWHQAGVATAEEAIPTLESLATLAAAGQWRNKWSDAQVNARLQVEHVRAFSRSSTLLRATLDVDTPIDEMLPRYLDAFTTVVDPFLKANPHIFENLICAEMRHMSVSTLVSKGWRHVAQVALLYGYCKSVLTMRAIESGTVDEAEVVKVVVDAWRHIRHGAWFRKALGGGSETSLPEYVLNIIADPTHVAAPVPVVAAAP